LVLNSPFSGFSMSSSSQTYLFTIGASFASVNTYSCIDRHEWHHDAVASTKIGTSRFFASASAAW
jgi:hypothetical protein